MINTILLLYCAILLTVVTYYCWKNLGLWSKPLVINKMVKRPAALPEDVIADLPEGEVVPGSEIEMEAIERDSESIEEREWKEEQKSLRRMGAH